MKIIKKYEIFYQHGGKEFDYLLYRLLNGIIDDKQQVIDIINSFTEEISQANIIKLIDSLKGNNISAEKIEIINQIFINIFKLERIKPLDYVSTFLTVYDRFYFNFMEVIAKSQDIVRIYDKVPNVKLGDLGIFKDYVNYLINHRKENYLASDTRRYIRNFIELSILRDLGPDIFNSTSKQFNSKIKNIKSLLKGNNTINLGLNEIIDNLPVLVGRLSVDNDIYTFTLLEPQQNLKRILAIRNISLLHINNNEKICCSIKLINKSGITDSKFQFKFNDKRIEILDQEIIINILDGSTCNQINNKTININRNTFEIRSIIQRMSEDPELTPFFTKVVIPNGDTNIEENMFDITYNSILELGKYVKKAGKRGEGFENKTLFLFGVKFCIDHPTIDLNSIKIYSGIEMKMVTPEKKWQIGELDNLIVNKENQIIGIGEMKTSIDTIQTAYKQLKKIQLAFLDIDKIRFHTNKTDFMTFNLAPELEQSIRDNLENPENNPYFYIVTMINDIVDIDPGYVTNYLDILFQNEIIKLKNDELILNPDITLEQLKSVYDVLLEQIELKEIELTSEILQKYIGKKNLIIFQKIEALKNAIELLSIIH